MWYHSVAQVKNPGKKIQTEKNPINLVLAVSLQAGMIATDTYCFSSHYSKNTMYLFFSPFHSKNTDRCMEMTFLCAVDSQRGLHANI